MSHITGIILALVSIATTCTALPDIHKYMSPHQLQSVFHVDNIEAVPHYEVVQLLHHSAANGLPSSTTKAEHYRRRRSIDDPLPNPLPSLQEAHHVKKDLSKNPYYSNIKTAANAAKTTNSLDSSDKHIDISPLKEHNVSFSAFGQQMNLTLRPTQGLFKGSPHTLRMWTARGEPNATHGMDLQEVFDDVHKSREQIGDVFQDEANMAAILLRRHLETGDLIMEGSIGHEMVIKPLPQELNPNKEQAHHIIYKRDTSSRDHLGDFAFMEPDDLATSEKLERLQRRQRRSAPLTDFEDDVAEAVEGIVDGAETRTRAKRGAPYMIYPEILVIVDYDGYRLHGGDNLQVKRYFISFWNGVDLRYRLLKGPRIRISIAGIIISRGRDATPYLERNRVGRDAIDSAAALTDMGKYLFRERRLPVYDIAVAITKLDMCRRNSEFEECHRGTAGFAYVGGACVVNKRLEKVNSVAIIEDTGGFSGIIVAAHEVGHLLGAVHDGSPPPSYLGGPGAQRCRWEDGYIMSDLRHTDRGFRWSPCTVQSFHHFLNGDTATCLQNEPHEDGALGRSLPGTLMTLDAQCRRDRGTYACFKDERVCAQLFCFDAQTGYCVAYRPAAEGSPCGNGMHCLDGRCAPLPTNRISDFAQQYPVVYNNADTDAITNENDENSSEEEDEDEDEDEDNNEDEEEENPEEEEHGQDEDRNENEKRIEIGNLHKHFGNIGKTVVQKIGKSDNENFVQHIHLKTDNNVEETSLKLRDDEANDKLTTQTTFTPTLLPTTTPTHIQQQKQTEQKFNAYKYLTRILANKQQWQFFLSPTTTTPIPTTTTHKPTETKYIPLRLQQYDGVIVKTSTSSSVSSSSGGTNSGKSTEHISSEERRNEIKIKQEYSTRTLDITKTTTLRPRPQQPRNQQESLLQFYSAEFRKQFQYYLQVLQKNGSQFLHPNARRLFKNERHTINTKPNTNIFKKNTEISTTNTSNYSVTGDNKNAADKRNAALRLAEDAAGTEEEKTSEQSTAPDEADNIASNEALVQQERKLTATTEAVEQHQKQLPATTVSTTTTVPPFIASKSYTFGGRGGGATTGQSANIFDAYFKKLQALTVANAPPTPSVSTKATISTKATTTGKSQADMSDDAEDREENRNFAAQFLKRTQQSGSSSKQIGSNSSKRSRNSSSNNSREQIHDQPEYTTPTKRGTTQEPALVSNNYIGDNTNNAPAVLQKQQQLVTTTTTKSKTSTTTTSQPQTQMHHKVKTQKLIRRQLLRTQIK